MIRPDLGSSADDLYARLAPFRAHSLEGRVVTDEELDWPLLLFWGMIMKVGWQEIEDIVRESAEGPGFSQLLNIERIPDKGLPWLSQLAGVTLLPGMTPAEQRVRIRETDGLKRGTPKALVAAIQRHLTGERTVILQERYGGDPNMLGIVTFRGETPTPELTRQDIEEQCPWWIEINYNIEEGWDYLALAVEQPTYQAVRETYRDYRAIREHE